jgi:hypothetical protein
MNGDIAEVVLNAHILFRLCDTQIYYVISGTSWLEMADE